MVEGPSIPVTCRQIRENTISEPTTYIIHQDAFEYAKQLVNMACPRCTPEELKSLQFGVKSFYNMTANMVVSLWKYYQKKGEIIDYQILKRSAESPLTQKIINGLFYGTAQPNIFKRIKDFYTMQNGLNLKNQQEERPDNYIAFINSDEFTPEPPNFMSDDMGTLTTILYIFYSDLSATIADGYLGVNKSWFNPLGSLKLTDTATGRVIEAIEALQEENKLKYKHVTPEKALKHLDGQITLKQLFAPDPIKGGNCTRKRKCTHTRKLRKNKRKCTHKRLSTTTKSRIMRGK